ncbi:hypothetical protein LB507_010962 [Fusarium sp. FIESC RH6]|nr:hypothetical protein LB507_010962 [Fusarium sp. FIESC RH6]
MSWTHDDLEMLRLCVEEVATEENGPNVSIVEATFEAWSVPTLSNTCPSTQANGRENSVIRSGGEDILAALRCSNHRRSKYLDGLLSPRSDLWLYNRCAKLKFPYVRTWSS